MGSGVILMVDDEVTTGVGAGVCSLRVITVRRATRVGVSVRSAVVEVGKLVAQIKHCGAFDEIDGPA